MYFKQIDEIVSGAKTETRRVCKLGEKLTYSGPGYWRTDEPAPGWDATVLTAKGRIKWMIGRDYAVSPGRGKPGVWSDGKHWRIPTPLWTKRDFEIATHTGWQPLRIRLLSIRREPLQAISEEDAIAEGCLGTIIYTEETNHGEVLEVLTPRDEYRDLWCDINGPKSWDTTGDVWALTFEVVQ